MSHSRNNKKSLSNSETELAVSAEKESSPEPSPEFKLQKDYQAGLKLFMKKEGFTSEKDALESISKELEEKVKPKLKLNEQEIISQDD